MADREQPTRALTKLRFRQFQRFILSGLTVGAQIGHGNPPFLRLIAEFERSDKPATSRLQALADSGGTLDMLQMIDSTVVRAHRCAGDEKTEEQNQALDRSRGGFSTKIHVRCNAAGLPVGVVLSEGEAHDVTAYEVLMEQRDSDPGAMLADEGYDSDTICHALRDSGATPEKPTKSNRKVQYSVSKPLFALRSRIECFIGHLKEQRHIAARYDKLATSFIGFALRGCIRIWARFVHRA